MEDGRESKLQLVKELRRSATELGVKRVDEDFLSRFLVGHDYDTYKALKAIQKFESFVVRRSSRWLNFERHKLQQIFDAQVVDVLDGTGIQDQKIVWIRVENWDPQKFTADELLEVSGLLCELAYLETKVIKHIDVIIDLNSFSLKHLYGLSPKFAKRMAFFMSECLPMEMLHVYVIRQPRIFHLVYSLFKPFVEEKMREMVRICGNNYDFILANVGSEVLPAEIGGNSAALKPMRWMTILNTKRAQEELKLAGYNFH